MSKQSWGGVIIWGIIVIGFGLSALYQPTIVAEPISNAAAGQEMIFLLAGGIVTLVIGVIGLIGFIGRLPGFNQLVPQRNT